MFPEIKQFNFLPTYINAYKIAFNNKDRDGAVAFELMKYIPANHEPLSFGAIIKFDPCGGAYLAGYREDSDANKALERRHSVYFDTLIHALSRDNHEDLVRALINLRLPFNEKQKSAIQNAIEGKEQFDWIKTRLKLKEKEPSPSQ